MPDEIELLPDHEILSGRRCPYFAAFRVPANLANRANRKRRIKARKSVPCWALSRFAGTWSDGFSATKRGRSRAGRMPRTRSTAPSDRRAGPGARAEALDKAAGPTPLRVYLQLSLDGDESTGRGGHRPAGSVDELCAAIAAADGLEFVGLMAIPPLDADPDEAFARLQAEKERVQKAYEQPLGLSAGMSGDLESGGQTRFDVCACRYRAIGATTSNVTLSSHSSHIFITDTRV